MRARRRPPEVKAEEAKPHQKYWLANGMEVRPFRWDIQTKVVLCSREISPGHRKRDFPVKFGTILFTTPPIKPEAGKPGSLPPTYPPKRTEYTVAPEGLPKKTLEVPTGGPPLPPVVSNAPATDALQRLMALHALKVSLEAALSENTSRKWSYFLIACQLNPDLRVMKHVVAQAELDTLAVDGQSKEILNAVKAL